MKEYMKHAHAVQTAIEFNPNKKSLEPKHLRVGLDMSKADQEGLATLLMQKGVFTHDEYVKALTDAAQREAIRHKQVLAAELDVPYDTIKLY